MIKGKNQFIFYVIIAVIVVVILVIYLKKPVDYNEDIINCIASKSKLYVSATCGHCARQKEILGDNLIKFNLTDCYIDAAKCQADSVMYVPTWVIGNEKYTGVKSIEELKQLTSC